MAKVYNLSYDIDTIYCEKNNIALNRKDIIKDMISNNIILLDQEFNVYSNGQIKSRHLIVYPVRTTIIFYSNYAQEAIAEHLRKYNGAIFYVLTEVNVNNIDVYIAQLRGNDELQYDFDKELLQIREELNNI